MTEEVGTHATQKRLLEIEQRAYALHGQDPPTGTPEVGTHAFAERVAAAEALIADAPGGGGGSDEPLTPEQQRLGFLILNYIYNGSFVGYGYTNGAPADTILNSETNGLEADNLLSVWTFDPEAREMTEVTEHATNLGNEEFTLSIDTTGTTVMVFFISLA